MSNGARIGAAYDGVAADYDRHLTRGLWMRRALGRHFARLYRAVPAEERMLELGGQAIPHLTLPREAAP